MKKPGKKKILNLINKLPHRLFDNGKDRILLITQEDDQGNVMEYAGLWKGVYAAHIHDNTDSIIIVKSGQGIAIINGKRIPYIPGTKFVVPRGASHAFEVKKDTWLFTQLSGHIYNPKTKSTDFRYLK